MFHILPPSPDRGLYLWVQSGWVFSVCLSPCMPVYMIHLYQKAIFCLPVSLSSSPPPSHPLPPPLPLLLSFPAKNSPPHQRPLWRPGHAQAISGNRESLVDDLRGRNSLETAVDQRSRVGLKEAWVGVGVGVGVGVKVNGRGGRRVGAG